MDMLPRYMDCRSCDIGVDLCAKLVTKMST